MKRRLLISILIVSMLAILIGCAKPEETLNQAEIDAEREDSYQEASAAESYVVIDFESYTEKVDVAIPGLGDYADETAYQAAVKQAAYSLFQMANRNDQNCLRRLAYTQNLVTTAGIEARNLVIDVKNGDEYLKYDFQPTIRSIVKVQGHGKATYARLGLSKAYYVEVDDGVIKDDWTGYANFGDTAGTLTVDTDKLYFHASQKPLYCVTEAVVNLNTIERATLSHNDEEGYYTIVFELDPKASGAARYLLPNLRENSGMKSAKYTSITETIEVWDNGFFKRFLSVDKWSSSVVSSTINFDTVYSYDAAGCDLSQYCKGYYATIKASAEAANAAKDGAAQ